MAALFEGTLVVRDGCVLAESADTLTLPVWRDGYTARRNEADRIEVLDPDGSVVAIEGESFQMGGGYIAEFEPADRVDPKAEQLQIVADITGLEIPERCLAPGVYGIWWAGQ